MSACQLLVVIVSPPWHSVISWVDSPPWSTDLWGDRWCFILENIHSCLELFIYTLNGKLFLYQEHLSNDQFTNVNKWFDDTWIGGSWCILHHSCMVTILLFMSI